MNRRMIGTSLISAVIGAGLMLLAVGDKAPSGLEGWVPVNTQVAQALEAKEGSKSASTEVKKASTEEIKVEQGNKLTDNSVNRPPAESPERINSKNDSGASSSNQEAPQADGKININTAGLAELQNIPGIGAKKAEAILEYRDKHGAFKNVSDLTQIKGIGPKVLEKMKPSIRL